MTQIKAGETLAEVMEKTSVTVANGKIKKPRKVKPTTFDIKEKFLALTSHTYPYGHEDKLKHFLPQNVSKDKHGNYYYKIGSSKTIFACHLDTVSKEFRPVKHVIENNIIKTDGTSILGADDKAGVTVLLYLISQRIPGTYYFFIGEEVGCIGSKAASGNDNFSDYERIVSFDRRDICSIITFQAGQRCCSEDFANALTEKYTELGLKLKPDNTGVYTDSAEFTGIIPECTNISVGYYSEHTHSERQDIEFLDKLCKASALINWESLPSVRNPKIKEYKKYNNYSSSEYDGYNNGNRRRNYNNNHNKNYRNRNWGHHSFHELDYGYCELDSENLIDAAYEEERKGRRKGKKFNNNNGFTIIRDREEYIDKDKDVYHTFRECLSERHFYQEMVSGSMPVFSMEEHDTLQDNIVKDWRL